MKKTLLASSIVLSILITAYLGLWFYSAQWFEKESQTLAARAQARGITLLGPPPVLRNFPFTPELQLQDGLKYKNIELRFPRAVVRGYPVPFTSLNLVFPEGVQISGPVDPDLWNADFAQASILIPTHLPRDNSFESLSHWQAHNGQIDVLNYKVYRGTMSAEGEGHFRLDADLQPDIQLLSTLKNYEPFIMGLVDEKIIEPFPGAMAITVLNSLAKADEKTGQNTVAVTLTVKNQLLSVGPIQALPLPRIEWDRHTSPARPL